MEKLYYPVSGGEVPSTTDRPGRTLEEVKETLGYNLPTDIIVSEKEKTKKVL